MKERNEGTEQKRKKEKRNRKELGKRIKEGMKGERKKRERKKVKRKKKEQERKEGRRKERSQKCLDFIRAKIHSFSDVQCLEKNSFLHTEKMIFKHGDSQSVVFGSAATVLPRNMF